MRAEFDVDAASASGIGDHDHPLTGFPPPLVPQIELTGLRMIPEYVAARNVAGRNGFGAFPADSPIAVPIRQSGSKQADSCASVNDQ
jgi:hypothetical protein